MTDPAEQIEPRGGRLAPAKPEPMVRVASGLAVVLLSVTLGVLLALFVGGALAVGGAAVGAALDR